MERKKKEAEERANKNASRRRVNFTDAIPGTDGPSAKTAARRVVVEAEAPPPILKVQPAVINSEYVRSINNF